MDVTTNARSMPIRLYGLHGCEGVAEYRDRTADGKLGDPYRILLNENVLKDMDKTYQGKPLYVRHVDKVDLNAFETEAAGVVVRSFYNPCDGKHWAEFMVWSDAGHEAIRAGWRLSNAYKPQALAGGGRWHNVEYSKEVMSGEYEHLAIVPDPRYDESIILTPEEFKAYNSEKEAELKTLANSKTEGESTMLSFFKKTKIENSVATDLEGTSVMLKTGSERTIKQLVNEAEKAEEIKHQEEKEKGEGKMPMANGEHMVKVGDKHMSVNELVAKHEAMSAEHEKKDGESEVEDSEEEKKDDDGESEDKKDEKSEDKELHADEESEEEKKKKLDAGKKHNSKSAADKAKGKENFNKIANAHLMAVEPKVELSSDKVARGQSRYGS